MLDEESDLSEHLIRFDEIQFDAPRLSSLTTLSFSSLMNDLKPSARAFWKIISLRKHWKDVKILIENACLIRRQKGISAKIATTDILSLAIPPQPELFYPMLFFPWYPLHGLLPLRQRHHRNPWDQRMPFCHLPFFRKSFTSTSILSQR